MNNIQAVTTLQKLNLLCTSDIVMDYHSGNILYNKAMDDKIYPASTTKILTAILVVENLDINKAIVVSDNASSSTPIGSSVMGIKPGEVFTVEQLLYGLLLPSGNDAAIVLAEAVSGNVEDFVTLMNKKAKELGCNNTNFVNPHGFHDYNHYSTAHDMATIFRYCLNNEIFKEIICTKEYTIPPTNKSEKENKLVNTNRMSDENYPSLYYDYMVGGKTGYTDEARGTFISFCEKENKTIIIGAFNGSQKQNARFVDTKTLAEDTFEKFKNELIANKNDYVFSITNQVNNMKYKVALQEDIYALVTNSNYSMEYNIEINLDSLKNLNYDDKTNSIAKLNITFTDINNPGNYLSDSFDLKLIETEQYHDSSGNTGIIILAAFIIIILLCMIVIKKIKRENIEM
ncbi:MAG: D-alanyl-D-alanine carboxypeptidase [Clostridia bacterium]|nr:D-alanyl-D-alanine carboxypeptidase [Clostridia bacterium]